MNEQTSWNFENGPVTEIKNEIRRPGNYTWDLLIAFKNSNFLLTMGDQSFSKKIS